jgi:hypothetical protein
MEHTNEGLTLWYDTADAPVAGAVVTVGVRPSHPANCVVVRYRVDDGLVQTAPARALPEISQGGTGQYFRAHLSGVAPGAAVEIAPSVSCAGREAPAPRNLAQARPWLRYDLPAGPPAATVEPSQTLRGQRRFPPELDFLGAVEVSLVMPPETIGAVPQGLRRTFYVKEGECRGPKLNARILPAGADWMLIQRDGVAVPNVRTTWQTLDGALLYGEYSGTFDLGPDGYERALRDEYPELPAVQLTPRFVTSHSKYQWLNRLQCVAIGNVDMHTLILNYDLYALTGGKPMR